MDRRVLRYQYKVNTDVILSEQGDHIVDASSIQCGMLTAQQRLTVLFRAKCVRQIHVVAHAE